MYVVSSPLTVPFVLSLERMYLLAHLTVNNLPVFVHVCGHDGAGGRGPARHAG